MQRFFQNHFHFQQHHEEHLEEPSRIHQQILSPFSYYSEGCHLQGKEMTISVHVVSNGIAGPKFPPLVLLCSCEKYTNVIKLVGVEDYNPLEESIC